MPPGSESGHRLACLLNLGTLDDLPSFSEGPAVKDPAEVFASIHAAGYEGVQFVSKADAKSLRLCREYGFLFAGSGRINSPEEIGPLAQALAGTGMLGATLHVGWGLEDDWAARALIEAILEWSERLRFPLWPETHRATIFQDMWRTRNFIERYPALRLNGDFSHWYTGHEMVYGGFEKKCEFLEPVMDRICFLHGRIGSPGSIQVALPEDRAESAPYLEHFESLWLLAMKGFIKRFSPGSTLPFAIELLSPRIFYGREFTLASGERREESDRWQQGLLLCKIARECWRRLQPIEDGLT